MNKETEAKIERLEQNLKESRRRESSLREQLRKQQATSAATLLGYLVQWSISGETQTDNPEFHLMDQGHLPLTAEDYKNSRRILAEFVIPRRDLDAITTGLRAGKKAKPDTYIENLAVRKEEYRISLEKAKREIENLLIENAGLSNLLKEVVKYVTPGLQLQPITLTWPVELNDKLTEWKVKLQKLKPGEYGNAFWEKYALMKRALESKKVDIAAELISKSEKIHEF